MFVKYNTSEMVNTIEIFKSFQLLGKEVCLYLQIYKSKGGIGQQNLDTKLRCLRPECGNNIKAINEKIKDVMIYKVEIRYQGLVI